MKRNQLVPISCLWFLISGLSPAILDTNSNGVSDLWEKQHNSGELFPETFNPEADSDSDGWTNAEEATAGTAPNDPNPPDGLVSPEIVHTPLVMGEVNGEPIVVTPEAVTVSWPTLTGKQYNLLFSPDLAEENWMTVEAFIGDGDIYEFHFLLAGASDKRFWRVAVTDVDTDGDILTNAEEHQLETDPYSSDTDGDGMQDGWEIQHGLDPSDDGSVNPDNGAAGDPDEDGIPNRYDSTPQVPDDFVVVIDTESRAYVPNHIGITQSEKRVSLDRLMESGTVAIANYASVTSGGIGEGTVEISDIAIEAREPVAEVQKFVLSNLLDLDDPSIFEEDYSVEVRPPIVLRIEVGQTMSNQVTVDAGYSDLENLPPTMNKAAYLDHMVVEWQPIEGWTNVDDHVEPPWNPAETVEKVNGKRIFPCLEDPFKTEIRHKIRVVVKASPLLKGKPVHVKSYDIDDSTSDAFDQDVVTHEPVIDTNGKSGGDNRQDYLQTYLHGMFWDGSAWGTNTGNDMLDIDGRAEFFLRVSMQPGDNYKAAASVIDASMYSQTQFTDATALHYIGPSRIEDGDAPSSPMLTVWRKLWVENDSMTAIPPDAYGYLRNDFGSEDPDSKIITVQPNPAGTHTEFSITPVDDISSFSNLENGRIIVQSDEHSVTDTIHLINHVVQVEGNHSSVPFGSGFRLYDDDGFGLDEDPLPRNDLLNDFMKGLFLTSFIDLKDSGDFNGDKTVAFRKNDSLQTGTVVNSSKDLVEQQALWVAQITSAYQFGYDEDGDPNDELPTFGGTRQFVDYDHSTVFLECCREAYDDRFRLVEDGANEEIAVNAREDLKFFVRATAAHEIGHMPGNKTGDEEHEEGGLMRAEGPVVSSPDQSSFRAVTVKRFRSSLNWSRK